RAAASDAWARASSHRPTPPRLARYEFGLTKPAQPSNGCVGLSGGPCPLGSGSGPFIKPPDSGRAPMSNVLFPPSTDIRNVRSHGDIGVKGWCSAVHGQYSRGYTATKV